MKCSGISYCRLFVIGYVVLSLGAGASNLHAEADGPDFWDVTGVGSGDVLNIRMEASASSEKVGSIPADGRGLQNLGCTGVMSYSEWEAATPAERERAKSNRWCKISYQGVTGWVAGRFLSEGGAPSDAAVDTESGEFTFGAWKVFCEAGLCGSAYQYGRGGSAPTFIRVKLTRNGSPELLVEGGPFTASGSVEFIIDGKRVVSGQASLVKAETGDDLRFPPGDDITDGLIRAMKKGRALQLSVVRDGEKETIDFDLDGFTTALKKL